MHVELGIGIGLPFGLVLWFGFVFWGFYSVLLRTASSVQHYSCPHQSEPQNCMHTLIPFKREI